MEGPGEGTITKAILEAAGKPFGPPLPPQRRVGQAQIEKLKGLLAKYKVLETSQSRGKDQ